LAFFVCAKHDRVFWWIQVEPHNVHELGLEIWIGAQLEGFDSVPPVPTMLRQTKLKSRHSLG
jgi:hypothetical protein